MHRLFKITMNYKKMTHTRLLHFLLLYSFFTASIASVNQIQFQQFSTAEGLPNSMVHQVVQDNDGFIWIATYYGLYRYDGYELRPYKSNMENPSLLPSNNVICIATDNNQGLWIGTHEGLARLNLHTGMVRKYEVAGISKQRINDICITKDSKMVAACIRGVVYYDEKADSVLLMKDDHFGGTVPSDINVQSICEDSHGDLLIATWSEGIYRLNRTTRHFTHYPAVEGISSFLTISIDSQENIWAGSFGGGLLRLHFSSDLHDVTADKYIHDPRTPQSLSSDYVYSIQEERHDHSLWIGTRNGISLMTSSETGHFTNYTNALCGDNFPAYEIGDVFQDRDGKMWISTKGEGVLTADTRSRLFSNMIQPGQNVGINDYVSAIFVEENGAIWTGRGYGVHYHSSNKETTLLPDRRVYHITQSHQNGHILISTHDEGLLECSQGRILKQYKKDDSPFIPHNLVTMTLEDIRGNLWVASYRGLGVRYANGKAYNLHDLKDIPPALQGEISSMIESGDGTLWIATANHGIVHLTGGFKDPGEIKYDIYDKENQKCPFNTILCMKYDRQGRVWAGTEGCGLCLYNVIEDRFESIHQTYNLPGDMVNSIEEDKYGNLWIGTNQGLARIVFSHQGENKVRIFTTTDGLLDNFFLPNAVFRSGDLLYFGCGRGYMTIHTKDNVPTDNPHVPVITRLLLNGKDIGQHGMASHLVIEPSISDFTLCFAALCYTDQQHCNYAYRLVGYDADWHYTSADNRRATYTNLPPGNYEFQVKATNEEGVWSKIHAVDIEIEPPYWRTWWAYLCYVILAALIVYQIIHATRRKMMIRNSLKLQMTDEGLLPVVDHHNGVHDEQIRKKQLAFEIRDLDYTDADEEFLKRAITCVNNHIDDQDFDIPKFVEEMATSRTTLFKKLKSLTGMNATSFIRDIRLKTACNMLDKNQNIRISDLAYQVGFNDPKYFSICFKKEFGVSPSEYVEQKR